jgi:hypothetical protein
MQLFLAVISLLLFASSEAHMKLGDKIRPLSSRTFIESLSHLCFLGPYPGNTVTPFTQGQSFCKGLQKPTGQGTTLKVGRNSFDLSGTAIDGGGSMQVSLSFDNAKTFKVCQTLSLRISCARLHRT